MGRNHEHKRVLPSSGGDHKRPKRNGPKVSGIGTYSLTAAAKALNMEEDDVMDHVHNGDIRMCSGGNGGEDYFLGGQIDFLKCSLRSLPMEYVPPGSSKVKVD